MSTWGGLAHTTEYYEVTVPYTAVLEHRPVFGCSGEVRTTFDEFEFAKTILVAAYLYFNGQTFTSTGQPQSLILWLF